MFMKKFFLHAGNDIPASLVVFLVAVPLCLGVAVGSNAPVLSGLIAGVSGGIVVGFISKSQLSVAGPAAGLITTVAMIIGKLPAFEAFLLSVVIAGLIQLAFGILKFGRIADFVPVSVLKGMLSAIGLLLIFKQLPHLVGYDTDFEGDESFFQPDGHNTFSELEYAFQSITPLAVLIGFGGLVIQWFWDSKWFPAKKHKHLFPAPLMVVFIAVVINNLARSANAIPDTHMVKLPVMGHISEFGSLITFPDIQYLKLPDVWIGALEIAIVGSLESLLSVQAIDKLDPQRRVTPMNRELTAQGLGNAVSGLLGGLPVTSVIVRSSANLQAGAKSKTSTIMHGVILMISLLFFPQILNTIPLCALASILIYTGFKLAQPAVFREQWNKGKLVFYPFLITIAAILFTDLLKGIAIGLLVGVYFVIRSNYREAIRVANDGHNYLLKFSRQVSFLNKTLLKSKLDIIPHRSSVVVDLSKCHFMDSDIQEMLKDYMTLCKHRQIRLQFKYLNDIQAKRFNLES